MRCALLTTATIAQALGLCERYFCGRIVGFKVMRGLDMTARMGYAEASGVPGERRARSS